MIDLIGCFFNKILPFSLVRKLPYHNQCSRKYCTLTIVYVTDKIFLTFI